MSALSRNERLRQKKEFDAVFNGGTAILSSDKKIKALYLIVESEIPFVKIAAAPSKKAGCAVWRNRFKRLVKEGYKKNKLPLVRIAKAQGKGITIIFFPYSLNEKKNKHFFLEEIELAILFLLQKIVKKLL